MREAGGRGRRYREIGAGADAWSPSTVGRRPPARGSGPCRSECRAASRPGSRGPGSRCPTVEPEPEPPMATPRTGRRSERVPVPRAGGRGSDDHGPGRWRGGRPAAAGTGRGGAALRRSPPSSTPATTPSSTGSTSHPDLDTVMYTLADAINPETGWGLAGETWRVMESLASARRGDLVQPRRPGPGHPLLPHPAPQRGGHPGGGHRGTGPILGRGHPPAAGDRRSPPDPAAAGRRARGGIPGVLRPPAPRRAGVRGQVRRSRARPVRAPGCSRPSTPPTSSWCVPPTPSSPSAPCWPSPGSSERLARREGPHRGRLPHHRRRRPQGAGRPAAPGDGVRVLGGRAWPGGTPRGSARWSSTRPTPSWPTRSRPRGSAAWWPPRSCPPSSARRRCPGRCSMPSPDAAGPARRIPESGSLGPARSLRPSSR